MTEYKDLTLFEYSDSEWALDKGFPFILYNVGWIGSEMERSELVLESEELKSLIYHIGEFIKYPVNLYRGYHICEMCGFSTYDVGFKGDHQGNGEIFVRGKNNIVYVAPTMILHYIEAHGYVPPRGFINAVRNVPTMDYYSMFHQIYVKSEMEENGWWEKMKRLLKK